MKNSNEEKMWNDFDMAIIELGWAMRMSQEATTGLARLVGRKGICGLDDMRRVSPLIVACDEIIKSGQNAKEKILALANATAKEKQRTQHAD